MSVSLESKATNRGVITFTIGQDKIQPVLDRVFNKVKKNLNAPGFRKGHMSCVVSNQRSGREAFYEDVLNITLPVAYEVVVAELSFDVVAQPKTDIQSMGEGRGWTSTVEAIIESGVKLGDYKDLEVSVETTREVADTEIGEKAERERSNLAELIIKEDVAELGDIVVIDFVSLVDGTEFDGGKDDNFSFKLSSGQFIPGFEDQLVGAKAGEAVKVNVAFPENYQAENLAGKDAKLVTTVHKVKAKGVPAPDDELVKDIDEGVETLDELKAKHRKELEAAKEIAYDDAVGGAALGLAVANAEIAELPEEMVHGKVHRVMNEFMGNMQHQGISPEMYFQLTGTTEGDFRKQYGADTGKRVKTDLVIEAIAKAEGFEVSGKEIEKEVNDLASEYNMEAEQARNLLSADMFKHDIVTKKAVDVVTSTAKVR